MSEDGLKRIFDPYSTTKAKGNGLGLATTYSIVKNHNGSITGRFQGPIRLDLHDLTFRAAASGRYPPNRRAQLNEVVTGTAHLIVDDEESDPRAVEFTLERLGYKVGSGERAGRRELYRQKLESGRTFRCGHPRPDSAGRNGRKKRSRNSLVDRSDRERDRLSGYAMDHHEPLPGLRVRGVIAKPYEAAELRQDRSRMIRIEPRPDPAKSMQAVASAFASDSLAGSAATLVFAIREVVRQPTDSEDP